MLVGWYSGKNPSITGTDLKISIDQHLIRCNEPPMDVNDTELLDQLLAETMWSVLSQGINRNIRRSV